MPSSIVIDNQSGSLIHFGFLLCVVASEPRGVEADVLVDPAQDLLVPEERVLGFQHPLCHTVSTSSPMVDIIGETQRKKKEEKNSRGSHPGR